MMFFGKNVKIMNKTADQSLTYPKYNSTEVKEASDYVFSLTSFNCRLNSFFREYFAGSLNRIAMNLVCLRRLINPDDSILDVGSFGIEPVIIKNEFPTCIVKALSFEGNIIGIGPNGFYERHDKIDSKCVHIEEIDVEHQKFPSSSNFFDIVTCFEVLEHLKFNPINMMKEIKRTLKPNGRLILTTPNINSVQSIIKILSGDSPQEAPKFHKYVKYGVIHPKEFTVEEIRDICVNLGFHIESLDTIDTRQPTQLESKISLNLPKFLSLIESVVGSVKEPNLGERILLVASKGGSIISETPAKIYEQ